MFFLLLKSAHDRHLGCRRRRRRHTIRRPSIPLVLHSVLGPGAVSAHSAAPALHHPLARLPLQSSLMRVRRMTLLTLLMLMMKILPLALVAVVVVSAVIVSARPPAVMTPRRRQHYTPTPPQSPQCWSYLTTMTQSLRQQQHHIH
eukprot:EC798593.1.p2 GENE.EC798593.1~~EC798593.1.p2  ORF type:complete len:145 (-),score=26.49 EC798593.1:148-582(-)